jgi:integrase
MTKSKFKSYIFPRGHCFVYRRDIPERWRDDLGKTAWFKSLATDSRTKADQAGRALAAQHDAILDRLDRFGFSDEVQQQIADIEANTTKVIRAIETAFFVVPIPKAEADERLQDLEKARDVKRKEHGIKVRALKERIVKAAEANLGRLPEAEREAIQKAAGITKAFADFEAGQRGLRFIDAATDLGGSDGIRTHEAAEPTTDQELVIHLGRIALEQRKRRDLEATRAATIADMDHLQAILAPTGLLPPPAPSRSAAKPGSISATFEAWLKHQSQRPETVRKWRVYVRRFIDVHGDVPTRSVTKAMVRDYVDTVATLPDSRGLKPDLRAGSVKDLLEWADGEDEVDHVSAATVTKHLDCMKALFRWASRQDITEGNPAQNIDPPKDNRPSSEDVRPFTQEELHHIVATAEAEWGSADDKYWLLMAAIFTGARREELAQLGRENLAQHGDGWVIHIDDKNGRRVKNEASLRVVPVHSELIGRGFLAHMQKASESPLLFPTMVRSKTGYYGHRMGAAFSRLLREKAGILDKTVRWHSIRHSFSDACREAVPEEIRHRLMGHTGANKIAEGYGSGHKLTTLARQMELIKPLG